MLLIGETERKAQRLLSACQAQLQYNKRLINDYGNRYQQGDWSAGEFLTTDGVRFMCLGFGQDPRGIREEERRPDYIVVDDVDNKKHVNNDRIMREGVEWLFEDLMGCFDEADGSVKRFVYANNNFHKNSITNRLKAQFKVQIAKAREADVPAKYRILSVPAVKRPRHIRAELAGKNVGRILAQQISEYPVALVHARIYARPHGGRGGVPRCGHAMEKDASAERI